jgi:hypothetical protein
MAVAIRKKKNEIFFFFKRTLHEQNTSCLRRGWKERERFLLPPSLKSLLDHGLLDSIFGKQTKAYLVAVKWNFESGHYNTKQYSIRYVINVQVKQQGTEK